eukprot:jgi/Orpsp1_1/1177403/evm.model.c7180000061324.1
MTHNLKCLHNIRKHQELISFADGGTVKSKYICAFIGIINEKDSFKKNVLYIPTFKRNLMSIHQLCKQYFKVLFYNYNNKNKVSIFDKNVCNSIQNIENPNDLELWHKRLGHFNIYKIKERL